MNSEEIQEQRPQLLPLREGRSGQNLPKCEMKVPMKNKPQELAVAGWWVEDPGEMGTIRVIMDFIES